MEIQIHSHMRAENFLNLNPQEWDVICITNSDALVPKEIQRYSKSYLHVIFDDIDYNLESYVPPLRIDVQRSLDYSVDKKKLLVSCVNGFSRSAAIAYAVKCKECKDPREALKIFIRGRDYPNRMVVKYAAEILGDDNIYSVFQEWLQKPIINNVCTK